MVFFFAKAIIKSLTEECPTVIKEMKEQYKFKSLNKSSVEDYISRFGEYQELIYQSGRTNTLEDEINAMLCFIDIYENEEQNENIIEKAETIELENIEEKVQEEITMDNLDDCTEDLVDLTMLMLYNTGAEKAMEDVTEAVVDEVLSSDNEVVQIKSAYKYVEDVKEQIVMNEYGIISEGETESNYIKEKLNYNRNNVINLTPTDYSKNPKFNISKGIEYAKDRAVYPNKSKYGVIYKADCTNFCSQIKFEGGVPKYKKYGQTGAWNYKREKTGGNNQRYRYSYSTRWCRADSFAKFFGVKKKYDKLDGLSKAVKKGSFIAFDSTNDGSWDHLGFVTATSTKRYEDDFGKYYNNFKVAQHTTNYHKWVSDKGNGWDTIDKKGLAKFCIIK